MRACGGCGQWIFHEGSHECPLGTRLREQIGEWCKDESTPATHGDLVKLARLLEEHLEKTQ